MGLARVVECLHLETVIIPTLDTLNSGVDISIEQRGAVFYCHWCVGGLGSHEDGDGPVGKHAVSEVSSPRVSARQGVLVVMAVAGRVSDRSL